MDSQHLEMVDIEQRTPLVHGDGGDANAKILTLKVRIKEKTVELDAPEDTTVGAFKSVILQKLNMPDKWLRLIYQGRMLSDDKSTLREGGVLNDTFVHCAVSNAPTSQMQPSTPAAETSIQINTERGFGTLMQSGNLAPEDVHAIRLHFQPEVQRFNSRVEREEGESEEDWTLRVEEAWMNAQQPNSEFAMNIRPLEEGSMDPRSSAVAHWRVQHEGEIDSAFGPVSEGTSQDFALGFVMGFLLGPILIFWLWERSMPRRQKLGIMCGVMAYIFGAHRHQQQQIRADSPSQSAGMVEAPSGGGG